MTTSFLQTFEAKEKGEISWDEYIHILLLRCTGVKHEEEDNDTGPYSKLRWIDPFGESIGQWSRRMEPIDDIGALEAVFQAYRHGTLDDVESKLGSLTEMPTAVIQGMKTSLGLLACQERRADTLKFLLVPGGFPIEASMMREVDKVDADKDPETFDALEHSRQIQDIWTSDEQTRKRLKEIEKRGGYIGAGATFDRGGKLPVDW